MTIASGVARRVQERIPTTARRAAHDQATVAGGQIAAGLFGAVNVQPKGAGFFRSQLTEEDLRARAMEAARRLVFEEFDNLAPGKALAWTARGDRARAGAFLEKHYAQKRLVEKGEHASKRGRNAVERLNDQRKQAAARNLKRWRTLGAELRRKNPSKSDRWLAAQVAIKTGDPPSTVRAAFSELGLSRKK